MSQTAIERDERDKKDRYLQWREHMRRSTPATAPEPAGLSAPSTDWSPDSLFDNDTF